MKREDGFYWVKSEGVWFVALFTNGGEDSYWSLCGCEAEITDFELEEIGEQIKKPDV